MFELHASKLLEICQKNEFPVDTGALVFMGFRGCSPIDPDDHTFRASQQLTAAVIDYKFPRCTLVQWRPTTNEFAVYPGSTVPNLDYIRKAKANGGVGANQILSGFYGDFRKGNHPMVDRSGTQHEAWRQTASRPIRRTSDDLDYDNLDRVEIANPGDNLHCGWCAGMNSGYSSAGCQVLVGFPQCAKRPGMPSSGPWRAFKKTGYDSGQTRFGYALFNGTEIQRLGMNGSAGMERVRFGSNGPRAERVQDALRARGFYEGEVDGNFVDRSLRSLLAFQESAFGPGGDDGICGPQTAAALGLVWP